MTGGNTNHYTITDLSVKHEEQGDGVCLHHLALTVCEDSAATPMMRRHVQRQWTHRHDEAAAARSQAYVVRAGADHAEGEVLLQLLTQARLKALLKELPESDGL